jgi:Lrp/AsnC family transcriptional regulator
MAPPSQHPGIELFDGLAAGTHEQKRQQRVHHASEPGHNHPTPEERGMQQVLPVGFAYGVGVIGEKPLQVHEAHPTRAPGLRGCEGVAKRPRLRNNVSCPPLQAVRNFMDKLDRRILELLQHDGELTAAEIADRVGLSKAPCWRRIKKLQEEGVVKKTVALLDARALNVGTTVFVMLKTAKHNEAWFDKFVAAVRDIPEVTEIHRMSGDVDYLMRIVVPDIDAYDVVYKRLISSVEFLDVSASFALETIKYTTALPLGYVKLD